MSANLTYHVRAGQLIAVAAGRVFHVPTHKNPSRVMNWEKVQELRPGKYTLWDHCFEMPHEYPHLRSVANGTPGEAVIQRLSLGTASPAAIQLGLYDWPGEYAQRFDPVPNRPSVPHNHPGSAVYVGDFQGGVYIHGWPPC